jgi:DNA-binding NtrC family response regulator
MDAFRSAQRLAASDIPVLIWGETGTGKELLARVMHANGGRADGPWVPVNCGAIPEAVLESELFGHERGGAPGVFGRRIGRFVKAAGGTLLLDEVEHLTPRLQQRVERAAEDGTVEPRGAAEAIPIDVRVIATAERDPRHLRQEGVLTGGLHAVLSPGAIYLPPLRERGEADMRALAQQFAGEVAARRGHALPVIAEEAWQVLLRHPWPGNVRQLRGAIERSVLEAGTDIVRAHHLPRDIATTVERLPSELSLKLEDVERRHIMRVLELTDHHVGRAASMLGIHRNTLSRKLRGYGLESD